MIYGDKKTGILVQGATGKQGEFHIGLMNAYAREVGARGVVAGVTPGKGGKEVHGVPVYNTVKEAMRDHDISASVIFVPAMAAADSACSADCRDDADSSSRVVVVSFTMDACWFAVRSC